MTTHSQTGSFDLSALNNLNQNLTQYFWFEEGGDGSYPWGLGAHVTLYPQSEFTNPNDSNYLKGQNILINTDGFSLRNGTIPLMVLDNDSLDFNLITDLSQGTYVNVATFGSTGVTIGVDNGTQSYVSIDYHSMQLTDKDGNPFFDVSDLRDLSGKAQITDTFIGNGDDIFWLTYTATSTDYTVTVSDGSGGNIYKENERFGFMNPPTNGATITATYETESDEVKTYTIGLRGTGNVGASSAIVGTRCVASGKYSYAEGYGTEASGASGHAEGYLTKAEGTVSHAEGYNTTASELDSHAEGRATTASGPESHAEGHSTTASGSISHAEGYSTTASGSISHAEGHGTTASGWYSHAEGYDTTASGASSHAKGYGTTAQRRSQTSIGEFNIADTTGADGTVRGDYALIVGNGTSNNARSNALTVDWLGRIKCGDYSGTLKSLFNILYPVGSYYETSDIYFDPALVWGGTWELQSPSAVSARSKTVTVNAAQSYYTDTIELLENSSYILLASTIGGQTADIMTMTSVEVITGTPAFIYNPIARTKVASGQGVSTWAYIRTGSTKVTAAARCYGYYTTSHSETIRLVAYPVNRSMSAYRWHRTG